MNLSHSGFTLILITIFSASFAQTTERFELKGSRAIRDSISVIFTSPLHSATLNEKKSKSKARLRIMTLFYEGKDYKAIKKDPGFTTMTLDDDTVLLFNKGFIEIKDEKYFQNAQGDIHQGQTKIISSAVKHSQRKWTLTFTEFDPSDPNIEILKMLVIQQTYRNVLESERSSASARAILGGLLAGLASALMTHSTN